MKFSHLHCHTQYSLLDGAASIKGLYKKAIADGMPAMAISDHGNMFGVFEFVAEAYKNTDENGNPKVKPVVGCEFYVVTDRHKKAFTKPDKDIRYHQILLAKNETGYKNLIKLTSLGFMEGMYGKYPRIDKELIVKHHEGLIATTCCLGAMVPKAILQQGEEEAENEFKWWLNIFQEDYYVELQRHGIEDQEKVNRVLIKLARKYNVKIIASNDSHYVDQDDFNAHDILLCINTGSTLATPANREFSDDDIAIKDKRFAFANDQFFFKNTQQMLSTFADLPEALDNTNEIIEKVELLKLEKDILLPFFKVPSEFNSQDDYLHHITWLGARERYSEITPAVEERINFELFTIKTMGFAGYFLIVSDFIKAGRNLGVFIGPGRGSAAGSVVAYCIGITNIDPMKYGLLFERFLNPDRKSMPDIDTDFDDEGRQKVIDYVVDKYGKNQVAQIITYGTMAAKSSIKDVARVMELPLAESNLLAKMIPEKPGIELKKVLHGKLTVSDGEKSLEESYGLDNDQIQKIRTLRQLYAQTDTLTGKVLHEAERLEGTVRNTGVHAAGIIIAPKDLTELIPVATSKDSSLLITQIEGKVIENAGVIKMDFLGLKTLSIIKNALTLIKQNHNIDISIDEIPLDDEKTYELFQKANSVGIFQFEAPHLVSVLKDMKPTSFEDLIALNALNRPGPAQYIPSYIRRKHGQEAVTFDLPEMEEYLAETFGITVYQEQVMLLSQKLAGFSRGKADELRKAMGKKDRKKLDSLKEIFMTGAKEKGHAEKILEKIWADWEHFAQYAFNKSHSTCYSFVSYQTAYLKAHYQHEFMAAVLNNAGSIEKITFFMEECKRMNISVLGPDVNESAKGFAVNKKGEIRFGLGYLKGVGEAAVESIIEERKKGGPFTDIFNFIKRINQRTVNKKTLESLIMAGSFDCFSDHHRAQFFYMPQNDKLTSLEKIIKYGQACQTVNTSGPTLFGDEVMGAEIPTPKLPDCEEWPLVIKLDKEKEVAGIYLSGHPLDHYRFEIKHYDITTINDFNDIKEAPQLVPGGITKQLRLIALLVRFEVRTSKTGNKYADMDIEDHTGKASLRIFGEDFIRINNIANVGSAYCITGQFKKRPFNDEYEFKIGQMILAENIIKTLTRKVNLSMHPKAITNDMLHFITGNVKVNPGANSLKFYIDDQESGLKTILSSGTNSFQLNSSFVEYFNQHEHIKITVDMN